MTLADQWALVLSGFGLLGVYLIVCVIQEGLWR